MHKIKLKQTFCGLVALLCSALPAKAIEVEIGMQYKQRITKPCIAVSQGYKEGKLLVIGKAEKVKESPLALQITGIYPLGKCYSIICFEKVGVNPEFEPVYYLTSLGIGKSFGKGSISFGSAGFKPKARKTSYCGSLYGTYKLGRFKLSGLVIVPVENPKKPTMQTCITYEFGK